MVVEPVVRRNVSVFYGVDNLKVCLVQHLLDVAAGCEALIVVEAPRLYFEAVVLQLGKQLLLQDLVLGTVLSVMLHRNRQFIRATAVTRITVFFRQGLLNDLNIVIAIDKVGLSVVFRRDLEFIPSNPLLDSIPHYSLNILV